MQWEERYNTGHPEIDRQHRVLFEMIEQIGKVEGGSFTPGPHAALDLMEFILQHAAYEEGLMAKYAYPEAKSHRDRHRTFTHQVIKFREDIIGGKLDHAEYQRFLDDWWQEHVSGSNPGDSSDKLLAKFLAGRQ